MSGVSDGVRGALSLQHGKLSQICCYHIKELKSFKLHIVNSNQFASIIILFFLTLQRALSETDFPSFCNS